MRWEPAGSEGGELFSIMTMCTFSPGSLKRRQKSLLRPAGRRQIRKPGMGIGKPARVRAPCADHYFHQSVKQKSGTGRDEAAKKAFSGARPDLLPEPWFQKKGGEEMKIVVLMKQTFDTEAKITLDSQGKINRQGVNLIINPYDEFAVEEALRIKEKHGGEVVLVSVGADSVQEALRQALAMGADRAVLINPEMEEVDEFTTATILAKAVSALEYDLILGGWRAIDDGSAQVAGRVAEILDLPVVNQVTKIEIEAGKAVATRDIEGGNEVVEVPLPAVLTAQKGLNEPRYPTMKGIMQAKKKPMEKKSLADLGLSADQVAPKVKVLEYFLPKPRAAGKILEGEVPEAVAALVKALREEAKVI